MNHDSSTAQLVQQLRSELDRLQPGDRLPSTRQLIERHGVSPVTVTSAVAVLTREGLVVARPGAGTFVAPPPPGRSAVDHSWQTLALADRVIDAEVLGALSDPPRQDDLISLATGYLHPSLMPTRALNASLVRATRLPDAWERPPTAGLQGLRSWFALEVDPSIDPNDVIITPGGQAAISASFRALIASGAPLLLESPTYPGALAVARAAGIRPVPVPVDEHGVIPELLAEAFSRTGARAFYCQPLFQNPTGAILVAERRAEVLSVAAAAGAFVIEDDYARWLSHGIRVPPPLLADDDEGRVVYMTSLTKVASPSLRVGAVIARGPVAQRLRSMRVVDDMFISRPIQEAAIDLVSRPAWSQHLRALSSALGRRSAALGRAVERYLPTATVGPRPDGGLHLWMSIPEELDDVEVAQAARRGGVVVLAGRSFYPAEAAGRFLRLTFSAAASEADLETGVRRLADAVPALTTR